MEYKYVPIESAAIYVPSKDTISATEANIFVKVLNIFPPIGS